MLVLAGTCIIAAARNLATRDDGRTTLDPTNSCNDVVSPVAEMPPSSSSLLLLPLLAALATFGDGYNGGDDGRGGVGAVASAGTLKFGLPSHRIPGRSFRSGCRSWRRFSSSSRTGHANLMGYL